MRKLLAFAYVLAASSAAAQPAPVETVTTYGNPLIGIWHGTLVQSGFYGLAAALTGVSPPALGQMADAYCRIAPVKDDLEMSCIEGGSAGPVTLRDGHVHIGNNRVAFEGDQPDAMHLRGHFRSTSWLGLSEENPVIAEAVRVTPQAGAVDLSGKAPLLRQVLEQSLATEPHDADAMKKNGSILAPPALGAVENLSYLGKEAKWDWPPPPGIKPDRMHIPNRPDFFSVYLVRFANGERLCGLHQREDGVLDALRCV